MTVAITPWQRLVRHHLVILLIWLPYTTAQDTSAATRAYSGPGILRMQNVVLRDLYNYTEAIQACAASEWLNGTGVLVPTSFVSKAARILSTGASYQDGQALFARIRAVSVLRYATCLERIPEKKVCAKRCLSLVEYLHLGALCAGIC